MKRKHARKDAVRRRKVVEMTLAEFDALPEFPLGEPPAPTAIRDAEARHGRRIVSRALRWKVRAVYQGPVTHELLRPVVWFLYEYDAENARLFGKKRSKATKDDPRRRGEIVAVCRGRIVQSDWRPRPSPHARIASRGRSRYV